MNPPPHSESFEKSVLSTCLKHPHLIDDLVEEGFTVDHFYKPAHGILFRVLTEWRRDSREIELIALTQWLHETERLEHIGGASAITDIYTYAPSAAHFDTHKAELREKLFRRRALAHARLVAEQVHDPDADIQALLTAPVSEILEGRNHSRSLSTGDIGVSEWLEDWKGKYHGETLDIIPCGVPQLDHTRGGIDCPGLTYIGAFPSSGKTAMLCQMAVHLLKTDPKARVLIFSLEMTRRQLIQRCMLHLCQFEDSSIITEPKQGRISKEQMQKIKEASEVLCTDRLIIEDAGGISIEQIEARVKVEQRKGPLTLIGVDYAQQVTSGLKGDAGVEQRMTAVTRGLQRIMKSSRAAVVGLSQLTVENGRVKMKYAASLEEDADMAIEIVRDRNSDDVEAIKITKDRQRGHRGAYLPCKFIKHTQTFQ